MLKQLWSQVTNAFTHGVTKKAERAEKVREASAQGSQQSVTTAGTSVSEMGIFDHIQDLRKHLVRALLSVGFFTIVSLIFMEEVIGFLRRPYENFQKSQHKSEQLMSIGLFEVITMNLKICLIVGAVAALPFVVREIWRFVSPALFPHEKRIALPITIASVLMFYTGVAFGFFGIIPLFISNTIEWAQPYANVVLTVDNYFGSLFVMIMIFGVIFEVPVILTLLGTVGAIKSATIAKNRRIVFLLSFIVGALLSPPDVVSQTIISLPLYLMCELSIHTIRLVEKQREARRKEQEENGDQTAEEPAPAASPKSPQDP